MEIGRHRDRIVWAAFMGWVCVATVTVVWWGVMWALSPVGLVWTVPVLAVPAAWLLLCGWGVYASGFRVACELRLGRDRLLWRAPLRRVSVPLTALRSFDWDRFSRAYATVELEDGRLLRVRRNSTLPAFGDMLSDVAPGITISLW